MRPSRPICPKLLSNLESNSVCDAILARSTQSTPRTRSPLNIDRPNSREIGISRFKTAYIDPEHSDSDSPMLSKRKIALLPNLESIVTLIPS